MKRIITIVLLVALAGSVVAQKKQKPLKPGQAIKEAQKNYSSKKIPAAVEMMREAMLDPKTPFESSTFLLQAQIYVSASSDVFAKKFPNAEDTAFMALQAALKFNDGSDFFKAITYPKIEQEVLKLSSALYSKGGNAYEQEGNFNGAADFYEKAYNTAMLLNQIDTIALFNIALSAEKGEDDSRAVKNYEILASMKYKNLALYQRLALLYEKAGKKDEASSMLDLSIEMFPEDSTAYLNAANENLNMDKYEKVFEICKVAQEEYPVYPLLYIVLGAAYENSGDMDNAEIAYRKAYEQDAEDYTTNFRIGAFYFNKGNIIKTAAENLPLTEGAKYQTEKARAQEVFAKAIPHLEKALELSPDNINVVRALRDTYNVIGDSAKATEYTGRINALEGGE
jgi:tetratricopeptide (TPR) repeat protein